MKKYIVTLSEPKTLECLDYLVNKRVKIIYNNKYYIGVFIEYDIRKLTKPSLYAYSEPEYIGKFTERKDIDNFKPSYVTNPANKNANISRFEKIYDSDSKLDVMCYVRSKIEILPADDPNRKLIGFRCKEKNGISVINTKALSNLKVSRQEHLGYDTIQNAKKLYNEEDMIYYSIFAHKGYNQNLFIKYYDCISIELLSDNPNDFGNVL